MDNYSFNRNKDGIVFASMRDINASFKDLGIVCDAIRYKRATSAISTLDSVISKKMPILYRKHNKYMGSRHELGGRKGRYPMHCAKIVRRVLVNAMANAEGKGEDPGNMYIVHATANKTMIVQRIAPKGVLRVGRSMGRGSTRRADLELARVEIGLCYGEENGLSENMRKRIKFEQSVQPKVEVRQTKVSTIKRNVQKQGTEHKHQEKKEIEVKNTT